MPLPVSRALVFVHERDLWAAYSLFFGGSPLACSSERHKSGEHFSLAIIDSGSSVVLTSKLPFFPALCCGASERSQASRAFTILALLKRLRRSRRSLPLKWAACATRDTKIAARLLQAGADVDEQDNNGVTALRYAVAHGNADVAEFLRAHGAAEVEGGRLSISPSAAGTEVPETFTNPSPRSAGDASAGAASL